MTETTSLEGLANVAVCDIKIFRLGIRMIDLKWAPLNHHSGLVMGMAT